MSHQNITTISHKTARAVSITLQHQMPKDATPYSVTGTVEVVRSEENPGVAGLYPQLLEVYNPDGNMIDPYATTFSSKARIALLNAVLDEYLRQAAAENMKRRNVAAYNSLPDRAAVLS